MTTDATEKQAKVRSSKFYVKIIDLTGKVYSDQTGRFSVISSKGNRYVMVVYDHDSNAILAEALKSRASNKHLQAMQKIHDFLNQHRIKPKLHIMDNECSDAARNCIKHTENIKLLLVLPHMHRVNAAEKAIDIFKRHFITGLATVNPNFSLHSWCRLLPLATTILNLLQP